MSEQLNKSPEMQPHQAFAAAARELVRVAPNGFRRSGNGCIVSSEKVPDYRYSTHRIEIFSGQHTTIYRVRLPDEPEEGTPRTREYQYYDDDEDTVSFSANRYPRPDSIRLAATAAIEAAGEVKGTFGAGASLEATISAWKIRQLSTREPELAVEPRDLKQHEIEAVVKELQTLTINGLPESAS